MAVGAIKCGYVLLEPINPATAPNNSIYVDSTQSNQMYLKGNNGVPSLIVGGEQGYFVKAMIAGSTIVQHQLVSKRPSDGKVVPADSDDITAQIFIGYAQGNAIVDDPINVLLIGPNVDGAVSGLGFTPGDIIYMSQTAGGYINDLNQLTNDDDVIIKVGIADCAAGIASTTAVDLISFVAKEIDP